MVLPAARAIISVAPPPASSSRGMYRATNGTLDTNWLSTTLTPRTMGRDVSPVTPPSSSWKKPAFHTAAMSTNMEAKNTRVDQSTFLTTSARREENSTMGAAPARAMYVRRMSMSGRTITSTIFRAIMATISTRETLHHIARAGSLIPSSSMGGSSRRNSSL